MNARAIAASTAWIAAFAFAAACGGRVDGGNSFSTSGGAGAGGVTDEPPRRPSGGKPGRPSPLLSNAAVASSIADDYCKAFSSCCFSDGQPPIDVARCRELTSAALQKELDAGGATESSVTDVAVCTSAILARITECGKEDVRFAGEDLPIFQPGAVSHACMPLLPKVPVFSYEECSASKPCPELDTTCTFDACSSALPVGAACVKDGCVDTANCVSGTCVANSTADVGAACMTNVDCRIGLVCFEAACAPTRDHPELATRRSSPYRIGADTCRAFTYL